MAKYVSIDKLLYFKQKLVALFATKAELGGKVDKVDGKQLSTNDYTTAEKNKLAGLSNYTLPTASDTVKGGVKVGANLSVTADGTLNASQPTKTSELTNDSGFLTSVPAEYVTDTELNAKGYLTSVPAEYVTDTELTGKGYQTSAQVESTITGKGYQTSSQVQAAINSALQGVTGIEFKVVTSLPSSGVKGVIYLIASANGTGDAYDEYIWVDTKFEKIGNTDVDLSGYYKKTDLVECTNTEVDNIFA